MANRMKFEMNTTRNKLNVYSLVLKFPLFIVKIEEVKDKLQDHKIKDNDEITLTCLFN